ncbi:unnamed protein product [Brachionus calyciflorus]|uniref:WW domain-containing protein n=1 Tax=Brachionus calyciflorus TaxID=104777 RepID=A0A813MPV4_9BILA|nr:unnamed protein product [Brachionus calyciflorus]
MSNNPLINSPSRISHAKRKMPDSFYRPPVQKTQLFSASEILPRSIHHSHTNSLPVDVPPQQLANISNALSVNNLYEKSNSPKVQQSVFYAPQVEHTRGISPLVGKPEQQFFHAKTFSLPCTFDPNNQSNPYAVNTQNFAPPLRTQNPNGDIPLPPGWSSEKTPTGQTYFINHFLKKTTWEDPRKLYNLPTNQSEISNDLRLTISKTIPLPAGWEEARAASGEIYFINHINKTTSWEDPRINIYMQQEQQKYYSSQQFNTKPIYNQYQYSNSQSSLSSSSASISSSTSSIPSISTSNPNLNRIPNGIYESNFQSISKNLPNLTNKTPEERVDILKNSLDEVTQQKDSICKQLEELSRLESNLKSKLSPKDLEDVLNRLKISDSKMGSFSSFEKSNQAQIKQNLVLETTPSKQQPAVITNLNSPIVSKTANLDVQNGDMDSTILADK